MRYCNNCALYIFFEASMYNKTIIIFGFRDIQNYQFLGNCYQPQSSFSAENTYLDNSWRNEKPHPVSV